MFEKTRQRSKREGNVRKERSPSSSYEQTRFCKKKRKHQYFSASRKNLKINQDNSSSIKSMKNLYKDQLD